MSIKLDGNLITVEEFVTAGSTNEALAAIKKKYEIPKKSIVLFSDAMEIHFRKKWLVKLMVRLPENSNWELKTSLEIANLEGE